jgi:hypothetical protein
LCIACKSDRLSPEVDFDPFLIPAWRIICFGKCRCHPPRVKSLKDTGSSALTRGFITLTSAARLGMTGVATAGPREASICAPAQAAFQLLTASMERTTLASSICETAYVTRSQTAYCRQQVSIYHMHILRSGFLTLLGANLGAIIRGFRRHIVGPTENSDAKPRSREPLPALRVLVLQSSQAGFAAP